MKADSHGRFGARFARNFGRGRLLAVFFFLYLPIITLVAFAFSNSPLPTVWGGFTLNWHVKLASDREILGGLWLSLKIAFLSASASVPLGDLQTRFIDGHIPDWSGYEYVQPTLTKRVTRGPLLDFTEPTAYTGAGMALVRDKWNIKWLLANFNSTKQAAKARTPVLAYRVDYARGEFQGFGFAGVHGKVANLRAAGSNPVTALGYDTANTMLNLFEADAHFIRGDFTWQGQVGIGGQGRASITADATTGELRDSRWVGVSTLVAYKSIPSCELVGRMDYLKNDKNGGGLLDYSVADSHNGLGPDANLACDPVVAGNAAGCDKGANRAALAVGLSYLLNLNTEIKTEYRFDQASQPVFLDLATGG